MKTEILGPFGDNYIYLVTCGAARAVVDPASAEPVLAVLTGGSLERVLVTHDHFDHTGGCDQLKQVTNCEVIGPCATADRRPQDGEYVELGSCRLQVLAVPGHTHSDVAYYADDPGVVFTGDTLFAGGCGRILGGTADQLWNSLKRLRDLPNETRVYCGHEYTEDNLAFAAHLEPGNPDVASRLQSVREIVAKGLPSVPSTLGEEKQTNPFFRCDDRDFQEAVGLAGKTASEVFAEIRGRKDCW